MSAYGIAFSDDFPLEEVTPSEVHPDMRSIYCRECIQYTDSCACVWGNSDDLTEAS